MTNDQVSAPNSTDALTTDLICGQPQKAPASRQGMLARWSLIAGGTIAAMGLWCVYWDRVYLPELLVMLLSVVTFSLGLDGYLTRRDFKDRPTLSFFILSALLATCVFSPSMQSRFLQASMLSTIRDAGGTVVTSSNAGDRTLRFSTVGIIQQVIPAFAARLFGSDDFFGRVQHLGIPANLLNERNLKRWNFSGIGVMLIQAQDGTKVPSSRELQMFLDEQPGLTDSYVSDWDADAVTMAIEANSGLTFTGMVTAQPLSAVFHTARQHRLMFLNVQNVDPACLDLFDLQTRPKRYIVVRSCVMTPEFMRMVGNLGPVQLLEISSVPESTAFENFCRNLVVRRIEWTVPITVAHTAAIREIQSNFELVAPLNDDSLRAMSTARAITLVIQKPSEDEQLLPLTDAAVPAILSMPALGSLTISTSSLSKDAIIQLTKKTTLQQLQVISDKISGDDIQEIRAAAPRRLQLTVMR